MEIQISYPIIFFTFFCLFFVIHKLSSSKKPTKTLPPGPWKLPLIGNLHQLVGSLPHRSLTNLANKYGPFMHLQLGQVSHIIVSSPKYAKEITKTHDLIFANRPRLLTSEILGYNSTDIVFSPYGNYWRQLRKICTLELFSAKRVQSFRRIREEEVSALVRNISEHEGSDINLSKKLFTLTNSIVTRAAFGTKTENVDHILENMGQQIKLSSGLSISDFYPSLQFISAVTGTKSRMMKLHKDGDIKCLMTSSESTKKRKKIMMGPSRRILLMFFSRFKRIMTLTSPYLLTTLKLSLKLVFICTLSY